MMRLLLEFGRQEKGDRRGGFTIACVAFRDVCGFGRGWGVGGGV